MKKYTIIICFILYLIILYYLSHVLMPFLFAILFYMMIKPIIDYFDNHALSLFMLALIYLVLMFLFIVLVYFVYLKIMQYDIISWLLDIPYFNQFMASIIEVLSHLISKIPDLMLSVCIFIISTFFLVIDYKNICNFLTDSIQHRYIQLINYYKEQCQTSLIHYFYCQLVLMIICFIHVLIAFFILKIPHCIFYSFMSALLDALPFIGIGFILLPMAIYYIIHACYLKSFYVFLIFLWLSFLRNVLESKIMSSQSKIPSFLLLLSMMVHIHFYGIPGLLLSPIHMNIFYHMMFI